MAEEGVLILSLISMIERFVAALEWTRALTVRNLEILGAEAEGNLGVEDAQTLWEGGVGMDLSVEEGMPRSLGVDGVVEISGRPLPLLIVIFSHLRLL